MRRTLPRLIAIASGALGLAACTESAPTRVAEPDIAPPVADGRAEFFRRGAAPGKPFIIADNQPALRAAPDGQPAMLVAPPSGYIDAVVNGGFESGFAGWTRTAIGYGYNGNPAAAWMVGASDGQFYYGGMPHNEPLPHSGAAGASATENGSTLATIYQDVTIFNDGTGAVRPVTLLLWLRWKNQSGAWNRFDPSCSGPGSCQDIVVQLRNPTTNALLTELWSAYTTGAPLFSGGGNFFTANYQPFSFDLTAYKGQTVRLQLANRVCCYFQYLDIDDVQVMVPIDNTPPVISSVVDQTTLWPPNHKMVRVAHDIGAVDAIDPNPTVTVSVTSNEPIDGLGDGDTAPDWVVTQSDGKYSVDVRAERGGAGNGRTYTILITATDASSNTSTQTLTVTVPKSQGKP